MTPKKAYSRLALQCSRSETATADAREKLRRWALPHDQAEAVIERLTEERYLDDDRFAHAYAHDKFRFNGWGRVKIRYMLRTKRIDDDIIDDALTVIKDEDYARMLASSLQSKARSIPPGKEPRLVRDALMRFAVARGFETGLVIEAVSELMGGSDPLYNFPCDDED